MDSSIELRHEDQHEIEASLGYIMSSSYREREKDGRVGKREESHTVVS